MDSVGEVVLDFGGNIGCSKKISNDDVVYLLNFPNIIILSKDVPISIKIRLHSLSNSYNLPTTTKFDYELEYDKVYFDGTKRLQLQCANYKFRTATGVIMMKMAQKFGVRYFTQLVDSVDPMFKHMYSCTLDMLDGSLDDNLDSNLNSQKDNLNSLDENDPEDPEDIEITI
jgi:hypothetical protein